MRRHSRRRAPFSCVLLLLGCVPAGAIHQAEREQAISRGHAQDATLPWEARAIAEDALDAWSVQLELLDGRPLPPDVAERLGAWRPSEGRPR